MGGIKPSRGVWKQNSKTGEMIETEKLGPENLRADLKALPAEAVTKEIADGDRVHELDPEHVRETLVEDYWKAQTDESEPLRLKDTVKDVGEKPSNESIPLNQIRVDKVRFRAIWGLVTGAYTLAKIGQPWQHKLEPHYIWFPEDNVHEYQLHPGNAPPDSERPPHMRSLELWVDITNIPMGIREMLFVRGVGIQDIQQLVLAWKGVSNAKSVD